jgi:aryl-alcohol dehydrogenase-like predicted oxidoreductase
VLSPTESTANLNLNTRHKSTYNRAAPFRELAAELGSSAATLASGSALSMFGADTVVLRIENRVELRESVAAAEIGPLEPETMRMVDERLGNLRP